MKFFKAKILLWPLILLGALVITAVGASFFAGVLSLPALGALFGGTQKVENTLTVESISPQEEIALVSIGIQGLERIDGSGNVLGLDVPISATTTYIPYKFQAKLGIDGEKVTIKEVATLEGDEARTYIVTVPEFIVIGHSDVKFEDAIQNAQLFGWTAPKVSEAEQHNQILSPDNLVQYLAEYENLLKDQSEVFYSRIVTAIDPSINLIFEFAE